MEPLHKRLKSLRVALGISQKEFADTIGVSQGTVSDWESGTYAPARRSLRLIANTFSISWQWIEKGIGEMNDVIPFDKATRAHPVPVLSTIRAGSFDQASDGISEYIYVPDTPTVCYAARVKGESMLPGVREGDYVLFVPADSVRSGDMVIAVDEWGDWALRRYRQKDGEDWLVADNPAYERVKPNEHYKIVGKVVKIVTVREP